MANAKIRRIPKISRYKGVTRQSSKYKLRKPWIAQITHKYIRVYIGIFESQIVAAKAYDHEARKRFGRFACVNFPKAGERSALTGKIRK